MIARILALAVVAPAIAAAGAKSEPAPRAWIGTFTPTEQVKPCEGCPPPAAVARAGVVRVLTPSDGSPAATGDVVVVSPLLGVVVPGHVDGGKLTLSWFVFDRRGSNDGVLVLPGHELPRLVEPAAAEITAIKAAVLRDEVMSGVKRAVVGLEIGAIDVDGDGKADFAVTYGCNAWGDGACQSRGQFFLARRGTTWKQLE